jgi:uncharacterized heparinase superfamily protein
LFKTLSLYWHTLRYLKPVQIYGRLWYRAARPKPDLKPAPSLRKPEGTWSPCAARRQSLTPPDEFIFLNQRGSLFALGWDNPATERLWRYNLHYFDDLNAEGAATRKAAHVNLLDAWVQSNPPGQGTGWEPYPTSLRIVNWIKWTLAGNELSTDGQHSLAIQTRWLTKRLERHLLGNHYFANAKALVFSGLRFEGPEAKTWLETGLAIITQQLSEQVLQDGGNFERSPMYHSIFYEDLLDLINLARVWPQQIDEKVLVQWQAVAAKMGAWLTGMTHPDGQISLFNDAAFGVTPTPAHLAEYAMRLGLVPALSDHVQHGSIALEQWPESGYVRLTSPEAVAILDVAPLGPDYLPSHANADTLSFELSCFGQRVIVNGGTSRYGTGQERLIERQTAAHSTLAIDDQSSSEVWGGFRVARRAYPFALSFTQSVDRITVGCSHNGYLRLSGKPVHRRTWEWAEDSLIVRDHLSTRVKKAVARYIFHSDLQVKKLSAAKLLIVLPNGKILNVTVLAGVADLHPATHSTEFGLVHQTSRLDIIVENETAAVCFEWRNE